MVYEIDEERIIESLRIINKFVYFIEENKKNSLEDEKNYLAISMAIFTIQNKLIELSEEFVDSLEKNYVPKSYSELPKILEKEKILDSKQAKILRSLFSYRNEIAHEYDDISPPEIKWCIKQIPFIKDFQKIVKNKLL